MPLLDDVYEDLVVDEGVVRYVYKDSLGYDTIGLGTLVDKRLGAGLRPEEIRFIGTNRIQLAATELYERFPWIKSLDEPRQGALINMAFQMGVAGVAKFVNSLALIKAQRWEDAAKNLKLSLWCKQTPNRANLVIETIRTGQHQSRSS